MAMECLVAVRDPRLQRVIAGLLSGLGMQSRIANDAQQALAAVRERRLDAVIVDCGEIAEGGEIIRATRTSPANMRAIAFAIVPKEASAVARTETQAHFVLQHPLSVDFMTRSLRAARSLMLQEQRRYFRCPVDLPVVLTNASGQLHLMACNLSAGGMALRPHPELPRDWKGRVNFDLPQAASIAAQAEMAWMLPDSSAGIRFTQIGDRFRTQLEQWISSRVVDEEAVLAR
jgi:CheY-like chemotaxis protein